MPISSSTRSDARWIDSSSSAETTSVGRVAEARLRPRPLLRQAAPLARGRVAAGPPAADAGAALALRQERVDHRVAGGLDRVVAHGPPTSRTGRTRSS